MERSWAPILLFAVRHAVLESYAPDMKWLRNNHACVLGVVPCGFHISVRKALSRAVLAHHPDRPSQLGKPFDQSAANAYSDVVVAYHVLRKWGTIVQWLSCAALDWSHFVVTMIWLYYRLRLSYAEYKALNQYSEPHVQSSQPEQPSLDSKALRPISEPKGGPKASPKPR